MSEEKQIKILGIVGPSGCGKDTAARYLVNMYPEEYNYVKLCTTRPQRNEEDNGYFFLHPGVFLQFVLDGTMLNAQEFRGWYYGLSIDALDKNKVNVLPMSNTMVEQMTEENRNDYKLKIIYIHTLEKERLLHILNREEQPDCYEICRRFTSDKIDYEDNQELQNKCKKSVTNHYTSSFYQDIETAACSLFTEVLFEKTPDLDALIRQQEFLQELLRKDD